MTKCLILMACAGASLAACTAAKKTPAASNLAVFGGEAVSGDWPSVVAIQFDNFLCTGSLVAPNLVISAAHCLDHAPADGAKPRVIVGDNADTGEVHAVAKFAINPLYDDTALTDFSYLVLSEPVANPQLIQVLTDPAETKALLAPGTAATIVGFGQDESGQAGVKKEAVTQVDPDVDGALFLGGNGTDTCFGDSGGPAFGQLTDGSLRVYGITSRGLSATCGGGTEDARMADGLCWIQQDSGVQVPGSKLTCSGQPTTSTSTSTGIAASDGSITTGKDLFLALGAPAAGAANTYTILVSAPAGTGSISLCFGGAAACAQRPTEDLSFTLLPAAGGQAYFASTKPLGLADGGDATILAFDADGAETAVRTVQFNAK